MHTKEEGLKEEACYTDIPLKEIFGLECPLHLEPDVQGDPYW